MTTPWDTSAVMPVSAKPEPIMVRGAGSYLWDHAGERYLDFVQGWAVNCLGHCAPLVTRALNEQASVLINASPAFHNAPHVQLAIALTARAGLEHAFLGSTGAEANEGAIKLARKWGALHRSGSYEIITTIGSFHGRTLATMAASGKPGFAQRFPPTMPGFVHVSFDDVAAIERAITARTVAVMVEPIQGEGGVIVPHPGYLRALRTLTEAHGLLLIVDEIQTGCGRTGSLFAVEQEGVRPDIMTLGKGLGGGLPLAALLARKEVSCFAPGDQGATFSGHPLICAVGLAVIEELAAPEFLAQVRRSGERLSKGLRALAHRPDAVRGAGLLWALALPRPNGAEVVTAARAEGLLINSPQPDLLRFMPALNVTHDEIDRMLALLLRAMVRGAQ
ncbi:MAG TPA: aminotransferase class III-fold pyridoxal phosphate-dependent enzyme [Polyangiales bacterium]|nr:aminotransferase class III-fold pyridoxal phosphate-dependent enzyme [Polyangiales bacterium]